VVARRVRVWLRGNAVWTDESSNGSDGDGSGSGGWGPAGRDELSVLARDGSPTRGCGCPRVPDPLGAGVGVTSHPWVHPHPHP
jgi:hypothetical protein